MTVNDGGGFSELDLKAPGGVLTTYYTFLNAVARGIRDRWPGRLVAFLPYGRGREAPPFALEDNVIMFLFSYTGNPQAPYKRWQGKVKHIGVYQWLYGMGWVIPNHWPHGIQDYLRWVRARGGKAFKGEAYVPWSQGGPKMWVLNNLLWNVDADVDALLTDYYEHAYGKEAAPAMARYFAQAEKIYERRRTPNEFNLTRWRPGAFQFKDVKPEDWDIMAQALDEANKAVRGEGHTFRVDATTRCFRYGRLWRDQYLAFQKLYGLIVSGGRPGAVPKRPPWNASIAQAQLKGLTAERLGAQAGAQALLEAAAGYYEAHEARKAYRDSHIATRIRYCIPDRRQHLWWAMDPGFRWGDVDGAVERLVRALTQIKQRTQRAPEIAAYWKALGDKHPVLKPFTDEQRLALLHPKAPLRNLLTNGSFEQPIDPNNAEQKRIEAEMAAERIRYVDSDAYLPPRSLCHDWFAYQKRPAGATVSLDTKVAHHGKVSVRVRGRSWHSGIIRDVHVPDNRGRYRLTYWYRTVGLPKTHFCGNFLYRAPKGSSETGRVGPSKPWRRAEKVFTINYPPGVPTDFAMVIAMERAPSKDSQLWIDDVRLERLSPEGLARPSAVP